MVYPSNHMSLREALIDLIKGVNRLFGVSVEPHVTDIKRKKDTYNLY